MQIKEQRSLSLDILRLIFIFAITGRHVCEYSGLISLVPSSHPNFFLANFLITLQSFGIDGFFLISGYFLVKKTDCTRKIINTELMLLFYSVVIFAVAVIPSGFGGFELLRAGAKSFFPTLTQHYWYFFAYMVLLLFAPLINRMIAALDQKELSRLVVFCVLLISVFLSLNPFYDSLSYTGHDTHGLLWIFTLYITAAYIRLYGVKNEKLMGPCLFALSFCLLFGVLLVENNAFGLSERFPFIESVLSKIELTERNSILSYLCMVSLFISFRSWKLKARGALGRGFAALVPSFMGVYLFQEHELVRQWFWDMVDIPGHAASPFLALYILAVFALLLAVAAVLYALYKWADRLFLRKLEDRLCRAADTLRSKS